MSGATLPGEQPPLPRALPVLLSFVAGYVDSFTYLGLFGLFVAQVTGSFVIAGAEFVTRDFGIAGKLLAIVAFLAAAAATAALIALTRNAGQAVLPWMLGLEALLLALFAAVAVFGPPITNARDWHGIVAGLFAATAMGAQSVLVRLLMKDIPQTNVMTGNITQLGIAITDIVLAWRRFARSRHDMAAVREFETVRDRLLTVLWIALGFMAGAASGAIAFAAAGIRGALIAVAIVAALALWTAKREKRA
ncbi:MAG TPA: DUF1275 family protein [Xanthobacteraceae bacterium]|nr:DUF1275 family protein [Xanthobacteraceae bacterium]